MKDQKTTNWFERQSEHYESSRFAAMTFFITMQSCVGSIAAAMSLEKDQVVPLMICAVLTMGANAVCIAQGPAKWCVGVLYASVTINTLIIITMLWIP